MTLGPNDHPIEISAEEQERGSLSPENQKLGSLLLYARGFVVLRGAVPLEVVDELRARFTTIFADCTASLHKKHGTDPITGDATGTTFWERRSRFRIFPRLEAPFASRYVLANPFAMPILRESLGTDIYCKSVASDTCVSGAIRQAPHRDLDFYDGESPFGATVNIPIMHCGLHNGPLEVWPGGSHLWHGRKFFKYGVLPFTQDAVNVEAEAFMEHLPSHKVDLHPGDLLIRDPGMWHRGNPNPTDAPRTMLTTSYFRTSFFYDYGDPMFNVDESIYEALDPSIKPLFRYCFDRTDPLYWKLHSTRAYEAATRRRLLGAPLRIGGRMLDRARTSLQRRAR